MENTIRTTTAAIGLFFGAILGAPVGALINSDSHTTRSVPATYEPGAQPLTPDMLLNAVTAPAPHTFVPHSVDQLILPVG